MQAQIEDLNQKANNIDGQLDKAAALVAAAQEQNKLLTARIESLTADREDKRRRHREEVGKRMRADTRFVEVLGEQQSRR